MPVVITGTIAIIAGVVFHFQGQGVVGPQSSFMYSNPEWITYGLGIIILGIVIIGLGIWLTISKGVKL